MTRGRGLEVVEGSRPVPYLPALVTCQPLAAAGELGRGEVRGAGPAEGGAGGHPPGPWPSSWPLAILLPLGHPPGPWPSSSRQTVMSSLVFLHHRHHGVTSPSPLPLASPPPYPSPSPSLPIPPPYPYLVSTLRGGWGWGEYC